MSTEVRDKSTRHDAFITEQLDRAGQRIRFLDLATAGGGWLAGTCAYAVLLMLLDSALHLSAPTRQTFFLVYLAATVAYLYYFAVRPLRWRVNPHFAARQLEQSLPGNRNRVANWIDLQAESLPGVIRTALGQRAAKDLSNTDIDEAISNRRAAAVGTLAGLLLVALVVLFFVFGAGPFASLFGRAFSPFGKAVGIATRTQVRVVRPDGGDAVVTIGSPVTIVAEVSGRRPGAHDKDAPSLLYRHDDNEPFRRRFLQQDETGWVTTVSPIDVGGGFSYKVTAGDGETPVYKVGVRAAPLITDFLATYHYRPYVGRAAKSRPGRKLEDLRGTEAHILARTNRAVKDGKLEFEGEDGLGDVLLAEVKPDDPQALRFRFVLDRPGKYRLHFRSTDGESYTDPARYDVKVTPDGTPEVKLTQPGKDIEVPVNGHVELAGDASDDIGLAAVTLRVEQVGGAALSPKPYLADKLGKGEFGTPRKLEYKDLLEVPALKDEQGKAFEAKPGMVLEYWLEAADACDYKKPNVGKSQRFKITLTPAKNDQQNEKDKQAAKDKQDKHEKEQADKLKGDKAERDKEREKEEQQEKGKEDGKGGEPEKKEGGEPERKEGGEGEPEKKEGGQPGDKGGKDDETRDKAEALQKALDKQNEKGKGGKDKSPEGEKTEGKEKGGKEEGKEPDKAEGDKGGEPMPGEARDSKTGGKPDGDKKDAEKKPGEGGEKEKSDKPPGGEKKPGESKETPPDQKPGEARDCPNGGKPGADGDKPGESKGGGEKGGGDPKKATKGDADQKAKEMGEADGPGREKAKRDLQDIADKADDPAAREAAKDALEKADKGPDGMGSKAADKGPTKEGGMPDQPGGRADGDRDAGKGANDGKEAQARKEKAARHRASSMQLEEFKKRVSPDVLKDAKMSPEEYERFLKDYAELAKRQPPAGTERDTPPAPGRIGTLPSVAGKAIKGDGTGDGARGDGRAKPPPEYREAHNDFLDRLKSPPK